MKIADSATSPPRLMYQYWQWGVLLALILGMLVQLWNSIGYLSITEDEADHLHAGYRYLQCNDFGWNPEHPPLVKMIAAMPLQAMSVRDPISYPCGLANSKERDFIAGHDFIFANPERVLTVARRAVSSFCILLLISVCFCARRMFGLPVAIISGMLLAFDPNILANGALVTTDTAAALGFLLVAFAAYRYAMEPGTQPLLLLGAATGFACCVKHSAILLAVILPALLIGDSVFAGRHGLGRRLLRDAGALLAVGAIAFCILWSCYGVRYSARPGGAAVWVPERLPEAHGAIATKLVPILKEIRLLPEPYLVGLQDMMVSSEIGEPTFLLGKFYNNGRWFYFPVAATVKYTLPVILMLLVSLMSWPYWKEKKRELLFLLLPAMLYLLFSMTSKRNIGSRHILPVLPLIIIIGAAGIWGTVSRRKWGRSLVSSLLVWQMATSLHAYPNYVSFSNELRGGPSETYKQLVFSDTD